MAIVATGALFVVCNPGQEVATATVLNSIGTGNNVLMERLTSASDPSGPTVAYWCRWAMDDATRGAVMSAVRSTNAFRPKLSHAELRVYAPGETPPTLGSQRVILFEAARFPGEPGWTRDGVLVALGLSQPQPVDL